MQEVYAVKKPLSTKYGKKTVIWDSLTALRIRLGVAANPIPNSDQTIGHFRLITAKLGVLFPLNI